MVSFSLLLIAVFESCSSCFTLQHRGALPVRCQVGSPSWFPACAPSWPRKPLSLTPFERGGPPWGEFHCFPFHHQPGCKINPATGLNYQPADLVIHNIRTTPLPRVVTADLSSWIRSSKKAFPDEIRPKPDFDCGKANEDMALAEKWGADGCMVFTFFPCEAQGR